MNIQAAVALSKEKHPERFCPVTRCLWFVVKRDPEQSQRFVLRPDCAGGYCPRHQHLRRKP